MVLRSQLGGLVELHSCLMVALVHQFVFMVAIEEKYYLLLVVGALYDGLAAGAP